MGLSRSFGELQVYLARHYHGYQELELERLRNNDLAGRIPRCFGSSYCLAHASEDLLEHAAVQWN